MGVVVSWPVVATVAFGLIASVMAMYGRQSLPYAIGQRVNEPVRAKVAFSVPDPAKTNSQREAARSNTANHFRLNVDHIERIVRAVDNYYHAVKSAETYEQFEELVQPGWPPTDQNTFERIRNCSDAAFTDALHALEDALRRTYVVDDLGKIPRVPPSRADHVLVHVDPEAEPERVERTDLITLTSPRFLNDRAVSLGLLFRGDMREPIRALLQTLIKQGPTIVYDSEQTNAAVQAAADAIPEAAIAFQPGQQFITPRGPGDEALLTPREFELLKEHQRACDAFLRSGTDEARAARHAERMQRVGTATLIAFLTIALFVYAGQHEPRVLQNRLRTVAFGGLLLAMLASALALDARWSSEFPEVVLAPCILTGGILAIVYPRRFAMGTICIGGVMAALILRRDMVFAVGLLTALVVNGFQLNDIRTRSKIVVAGLITGVAVGVANFAGALVNQEAIEFAWSHALRTLATASGTVLLFWSVLPFLERALGVATPLTLLEWSESRQPLLQKLANEAPGTHQHSLTLAKLADAACNAIGADGLLASVGALYHDIGKIPKAQYFVENQQAMMNRHQNLAPTMSLLIIVAHVKDGVEMAREYKLPRALHPFIQEHHGTTVVKYFHHVAAEKQPEIASGRHDREVSESEFRYPGPKPRTRESAVLMMCDGVEGAVRSLKEPTPGRIESVVHQIIMDRLLDGQFDDCDITLSDVRRAEDALVKTLRSLYHGRVSYPGAKKDKESKAGAEVERTASGERADRVRKSAG